MKSDAHLMYIIDDINVACVGWGAEDLVDPHCTRELTVAENSLPAERSRSTVLGTTERSSLNLIVWFWYLKGATGQPRADKRAETLALTAAYFSQTFQYPHGTVLRITERIVGRLVWIYIWGVFDFFTSCFRLSLPSKMLGAPRLQIVCSAIL